MGVEINKEHFSKAERALFATRLRSGIVALESLLKRPGFGLGKRTVGLELELFLVDEQKRAKSVGRDIAKLANCPSITPEIGRFDIELSTEPVTLAGTPFSLLRANLRNVEAKVQECAAKVGARAVPVSVLPTLRREDFGPQVITDLPRYRAIARGMRRARRAPFQIDIAGDDPLRMSTDDAAMEGANAGFQVHLSVHPDDFASFFNAAQMLTGPVMAASGNSPFFLGHRLWEETRIALFKQAGDDRPLDAQAKFRLPARIGFGTGWVREGAIELFAESVALHEPLLLQCGEEDPVAAMAEGSTPSLWELRLHHGTVWKWNRPVYDPAGGGHLRIELRALPSGPTIDDMLANAAVLIGGILALAPRVRGLLPSFPFALAERNFYRAAQFGLGAELAWPSRKHGAPQPVLARNLLEDTVLPLAAEGLRSLGIVESEVTSLLGTFSQRLHSGITGAVWQRQAFDTLMGRGPTREEALPEMLEHYMSNVASGLPVAFWPMVDPGQGLLSARTPRVQLTGPASRAPAVTNLKGGGACADG